MGADLSTRIDPGPKAPGSADALVCLELPDEAVDFLALYDRHPERYPCLLESTLAGGPHARYDILFAYPQQSLILPDLHPRGDPVAEGDSDFLRALDRAWARERQPTAEPALPFRGGWFIYLGYELAGQIETRLRGMPAGQGADGLPVAAAIRFPAALIRDRLLGRYTLVCEAAHDRLVPRILADLRAAASHPIVGSGRLRAGIEEEDPARFLDGVARVRRYIVEGDVFQVNLSRAWRIDLLDAGSDARIYADLRRRNPAPFAGIARIGDRVVISSSPERLVRVVDGVVETRPIAGTRPRGRDRPSDAELSTALLAHPKERAEHIMLIDLERNDLGRICRPGSVRVDELMTLESYRHVHHIVSNIRGTLAEAVTPGEVLRAVFPGGTITGCPKVRCMEIIAELEQAPRGAYTGAMGYLNHDGDMDLNILIRTLVRDRQRLWLRAGAGIVADSVAERELDETRDKARGLLNLFS